MLYDYFHFFIADEDKFLIVSRVELRSSPSVAAAAVAVGAAVVLLLTALAVITG